MKRKLLLAIVAGIALSAGAWASNSSTPEPQRWQYQFQEGCSQAIANSLGTAGWELVTTDPSSSHRTCIFKRPLP